MPLTTPKPATKSVSLAARTLMAGVRGYQRVLSPVLPAIFGPHCGCRFYPTCSHYALEALRVHGAAWGAALTAKRLLKCTPLHPGGVDLVPPPRPRPICQRYSTPRHFTSHG